MKPWIPSALLCVAASFSAIAQVNQAEFNTMTWSWANPIKWLAMPNLGPGGSGYFQDNTPSSSDVGDANDWRKWRFVYYTGLTGTHVTAWADWGLPNVPAPVVINGNLYDPCQHTHVSYGVWLQYAFFSGGQYYAGVVGPLQGGTKSGIRVNNSTCRHSVDNSLKQLDPRFGWGRDLFTMQFPKTGNIWTAMILGASAISHGTLDCPTIGCVNKPWLGAYAIGY